MADNDIIDFYKKADTDSKPEEPLKEQVETPEPVVSEAVSIPVPESNDPFDKFLFNLAEKLKTEKKITEQQQQQFNERIVQPTTNPEDPFAKFLESFAGLVKEDENINKEENIKEATIDFINKLKNDDFFDRDVPKVIPKVKQVKSKSKKYLPPKFAKKVEKVEEELPVIEQSTEPEQEVKQPEPSNPYLKELQTSDKKKNKIEDKISGLSDIKKIIAQQVQEQLSKYPNLGFTGGGGGTNAVQYAEGGTMNGNLTVNGTVNATTYLSGGTNLLNILSSSGGGGGYADRFVSGPSQFILDPDGKLHPLDNDLLTLQSENAALSAYTRIVLSPYGFFAYDNNSNSITFDSVTDDVVITSQDLYEWTFNQQGILVGPNGYLTVNALSSLGRILSGGKDLLEIFALSGQGGGGGDFQTLSYNELTSDLSISNGNTVSLSSINSTFAANSANYILNGGNSTTTALSVGTSTNQHLVLETGGTSRFIILSTGNVGIGNNNPNNTLTVTGSISGTNNLTIDNTIIAGNSTNNPPTQNSQARGIQWANLGGLFSWTAGIFGYQAGTPILGIGIGTSAGTTTEVAHFRSTGMVMSQPIYFGSSSGTSSPSLRQSGANLQIRLADNSDYTTLLVKGIIAQDNISSTKNISSSSVSIGTASGNERLTVVGNISSTGTIFASDGNSNLWNAAYSVATAYQTASSSFATNSLVNSVSSLLTPLTLTNTLTGQLVTNTAFANYQTSVAGSTATLLPTSIYQNASGNWQTAYTNLVSNSAAYLSGVDLTFLQEPSANWNSTYTTVQSNSSNWQNAYNTATVYQSNSSSYATTAYTDATYLPLSGGTLTGNLSVYGNTFINNNLTVGGNLTALGTATFANTIFTTTSALSVVNTGPGPALYVYQAAGPYDVASFYDGDGIEVLHVGNAGPGGLGKVGVNESFPNEELTVRGSISATGAILASAIDISTNILSAGVNLSDIFTGKEYINSNFFPLSGGTVTGKTIISHDGDVVDPNTPYTLSIQRNAGSTWLEILNNGGPNQGAFFGMTSNNFEQWNYQGGDILFYTAETPSDGNERLIIKNNGNVGIGGSNPASRLQVNGTITTDAISFTSPAEFYSTGGSIRFLHIDDTTNSNNDIYFKIEHENSDNQPTGYITIGTRGAVNKARYSGQVSGMTTDVVIRANIGGWDGNSIILTFDGVATIDTVIAIWNAANPSNQVTLISGDGTQIPDNGAVIGLAGGGDAAYIQGQNSEFRIEQAGSNLADIKSRNVILSDGNTYTGTFNAQGKLSNNRTYDLPDADGTLALGNQTLNTTDNVQFNQVNANVYLSGGVNLYNLLSSSGGGGGDPAVNTVVYTYSATWIDTSTVVQTNSASWAGGGGSTEKRFDFVTTGGIDYSYSGTAAQYTIETSPTWKLIRLTYANNGTISNSASALNSWTGRLTATYV